MFFVKSLYLKNIVYPPILVPRFSPVATQGGVPHTLKIGFVIVSPNRKNFLTSANFSLKIRPHYYECK